MGKVDDQNARRTLSILTSESSYSMAFTFNIFILSILYFFIVFSYAVPVTLPKPNSLLIPIKKDTKSLQYYATLKLGNRLPYIQATIDLGGDMVWLNCDNYTSTSKRHVSCDSKLCENVGIRLGCIENKPGGLDCSVGVYNPFMSGMIYAGSLDEDSIKVGSTDGARYLPDLELARLAFSCANSDGLRGLAKGISGMVGLARTQGAFQKQLTSYFKLPQKFALCIPSSNEKGFGDLFIGGGPYYMHPYPKDLSRSLVQTPLVTNPMSTAPIYSVGEPSYEYFIGVKSIRIGGRDISFNTSLLTIDKNGVGGTKLSTIAHFTILHTSIYKSILGKFVKKFTAMNVTRVAPVYPFGACFSSKTIKYSKTGLAVPAIDLVLQNNVTWRMYGHNSMKQINMNVTCLAFVDGGSQLTTSIVLGGHQLEDNLIEFDLVTSKFGFTNSLLLRNTSCSHFRPL